MAVDVPKTLSKADIVGAAARTRVPPVVEDPPLSSIIKAKYRSYQETRNCKTAKYTKLDYVGEYIPCVNWLRTYQWKQWLLYDVLAGLAVAAMVIPQGMSYAQNLAFLPQVYGIYGAFVPCLVYAALGSSKHLAVGPVAVTSLLLGSGLSSIFGDFTINPSSPQDGFEEALQQRFNHAAIQISFLSGCFYTAIGVFQLGFIVNYLSASVISGFMTGAAAIILSTQVKYVTGMYNLPRSDTVIHSLELLFNNMQLFRWPEFGLGFGFIIVLLLCLYLGSRFQRLRFLKCIGPILVMVLSLIIENAGKYYIVDANDKSTPVFKDVGPVEKGLPAVTVNWWFPLYDPSKQLVLAAVICLLDIAESTTVARRYAQQHRYKLNYTQELRALGIANVVGAFFNSYTTTGAFSRTAINSLAGAKTLMSSFVTGIAIGIVLLFVTPVLTHLSINVQGAIVIVAVLPLFDYASAFYFWDVSKLDFLAWMVTFFITSAFGALAGIAAGVGVSLVIVILQAGFPRIIAPGPLPETLEYCDPEVYPQAAKGQLEGILVMRIEAPMFFGNSTIIQEHADDAIALRVAKGETMRVIVWDMTPVTGFDGSACESLNYYLQQLEDDGQTLVIANPGKSMLLSLQRSGLIVKLRPENLQLTLPEALARAQEIIHFLTGVSGEKSV